MRLNVPHSHIREQEEQWALARAYAAAEHDARQVRQAAELMACAETLQARLPASPVTLWTRAPEATAVVGACTALRASRGAVTAWQQVRLQGGLPTSTYRPVWVELGVAHAGLLSYLRKRCPDLVVVDELLSDQRLSSQLAA